MDETEKTDPTQEKFWTTICLEKDDGRISHDRQELRAATALVHLRKGSLNEPFYIMEAREGIKAQLPFWVIPMAGETLPDDMPGESEIPVV